MTKGGKREGAGRKPGSLNKTPAKTKRLYERLTDTEYAKVRQYIKSMRAQEQQKEEDNDK